MEHLKGNTQIKGKSIARTSIESYHSSDVQRKIPKQEKAVVIYLTKIEAQTSRGIASALGMERSSVTRTLFNLQEEGVVVVAKVAPCPITGRNVRWYSLP